VPESIVDGLETIQIEIGRGQRGSSALRLCHGLVQAVGEQHAIGQIGQRVVVSDVFELFFVFL